MTFRPKLDRVWASAAPPSNIQDPDLFGSMDKVARGWEAEIPPFQWFNWLLNRNDVIKLALAERGIFSWGEEVSYRKGALTFNDGDNKIYVALQANKGQNPDDLGSVYWEESAVNLTVEEFQELLSRLNSHIEATSNPHEVTAEQVGAYTKAKIDELLQTRDTNLSDHEKDFNNPHEVTAAQAGAVPITGGEYTGEVKFQAMETEFGAGTGTKTSIYKDDGKFGIKQGDNVLGINSTSNLPYFWSAEAPDGVQLLEEFKFEELKLKHEPDYAVPTPDFYAPMTSDIHIYEGSGYTLFSRPSAAQYVNKQGNTVTAQPDEPRFETDGILLSEETLGFVSPILPAGTWSFSIGLDLGDGMIMSCPNGFLLNIMESEGARTLMIGLSPTNRASFPITLKQYDNTLTVVSAIDVANIYLNGVKIGAMPTESRFYGQDFHAGWYKGHLRNLRVWNIPLTEKQVKTL